MHIRANKHGNVYTVTHWSNDVDVKSNGIDSNGTDISVSVIKITPVTKTCLYNFDPLKPHFYIVKLGFTGVYIIFLISAQNIDCGYSFEPSR